MAQYYVELKAGFDQEASAKTISKRVKGKIGYVYRNFPGFSIYDISESDVDKIRRMPEVKSVTKSTLGYLAS